MGKNNKAQRTKNNVQPSNSSRSAELLGTAVPKFVGFSAVKDGGYIPVLPGLSLCSLNEVEMNNVDSNFQIVLKKMNKKDATTKYKALQEFATLCENAELPAVEGVLPFWPRLYCALSIDIDHRVREAAQLAHAAIVKRMGKGIAMYLKQLAGAWFTSQYDTYPPASSAAVNSFSSTFPPWKIVDAIVHCQCEILLYIKDNIVVQTAQTLSVQKSLTNEEMETKYQRVLIANLQGYGSYFKKVPLREIDKTSEIHDKILSSSKFWKLAKHDVLPIKTAFFNVLTSIMENADKLLRDERKRTVTTIMNSLDESEPGILSAVWESMLVAVTKIDDWHLVVNLDKFVLPKLWRVLRSGGQCCASVVYPNLLPFVSQFSKLSVDVNDLYTKFFDNMRQGFSAKSVQTSRSETLAVATSFVECLRYTILVNVENTDLCVRLLQEQLVPVVEACMTENVYMKQFCFSEVTHLVRYWSKNRANESYKSYATLMRRFWIELRSLFDKLIDVPQEIATSHTVNAKDAEIEFLLTLKNAPDRARKKLKVKFCDPDDPVESQPQVRVTEVDTDAVFNAELREFVNALCAIYFDKINDQRSAMLVEQFTKLVKHFACRELFVALLESSEYDGNDFFELYDKGLKPLLSQNSETMEQVFELIFHLIAYMSDAEKDRVLKSLIELDDVSVTRNVVYCSLSKFNRNDRVIKKWYTQASVTKLLIDVAREMISPDDRDDLEKNRKLILLAFETSETGGLLINEEGANEIVSILCDSLSGADSFGGAHFAQSVAFIAGLMTLVWDHERTTSSAVQILETLFELCARGGDDDDSSSVAVMRRSWKEGLVRGVRVLPYSEFNDLIKRCAIVVWSKIIHNARAGRAKDTLLDLATDLLEVVIRDNDDIASERAEEIALQFLTASDVGSWLAEATAVAIYGEAVTGNLHVSGVEEKVRIFRRRASIDITNDATSPDSMANCLSWAWFAADLLSSLHERLRRTGADDTVSASSSSSEGNVESCDLNSLGIIAEILANILYVTAVAETYSVHYKSTECYNDVKQLLDSLKRSLVDLRGRFAKGSIHDELLRHVRANRASYGYMLPYVIRAYHDAFEPCESPAEYYKICVSDVGGAEGDEATYARGIQVLSDHWTPGDIPSFAGDDTCALIAARLATRLGDESVARTAAAMEKIMSRRGEDNASLLLRQDISDVSWDRLLLPLEAMRLLATLVREAPSRLTREHWDFVLISLTMWQQSVHQSKRNCTDIKVIALITAVSQLYYELQTLLNVHEREPIPELPSTLSLEWKDVFAGDVYSNITETWMFCADVYNNRDAATTRFTVPLHYLGKAISVLDEAVLFGRHGDIEAGDFDRMLELSLKLLQSSTPDIQLDAYHALKHAVSELAKRDKAHVESDNFEPNDLNIKRLEDVLLSTQTIVSTMLAEFKLCDTVSCTIQPFTDSYTYTLGYLLAWVIVLDMCANADGDLRYQYAEMLKDDLFPCLLNNIFKLMPVEVLHDNKSKTAKLLEIFTTAPSFNFGESWTERRLDHIVCWLYTNCLRHLPVLVRQWWSTTDSRVSVAVDKITTHYVSPMLCQEELLNNRLNNLENMQIKVHPTAREVVASYQMDDTKLELIIVLPLNHPLGTVAVETDQHACSSKSLRNCHMQLSIFLTHQNGSIWDCLVMWKRNLDKKFAGVEECYICFSIFHISTHKIPKLSCRTCRKKFHTPCLYKWFYTSQKSTCPICRNVF